MYAERHDVSITTATSGAATGFTPMVNGRIVAINYTLPTGSPLASTTDLTVTLEESGLAVMAATNITVSTTYYPVKAATTTAGAASTLTEVPIYAANERVKLAIAQGGNTTNGTITVVVA